jgi:hypothetical protein
VRVIVLSTQPHRQTAVYFRVGGGWSFAGMPYGNLWRTHRRLIHRFFNPSVADQFDDKIYKAVIAFLHLLSESPECFLKHAHLYVNPTQSLYYLGLTA